MFASLHTSTLAIAHVQSRGSFADRLKDLVARIQLGLTAHEQRRQLASLDDAMLADIGLSRADALAEFGRPLWDVPANWRR